MKQLRLIFHISCFVLALYFLIFSFSDISIADETLETRIKKCSGCCDKKQTVCYNITADRRLCYAEFLECVATCKSEGKTPSEWSDCWSQSGE